MGGGGARDSEVRYSVKHVGTYFSLDRTEVGGNEQLEQVKASAAGELRCLFLVCCL